MRTDLVETRKPYHPMSNHTVDAFLFLELSTTDLQVAFQAALLISVLSTSTQKEGET